MMHWGCGKRDGCVTPPARDTSTLDPVSILCAKVAVPCQPSHHLVHGGPRDVLQENIRERVKELTRSEITHLALGRGAIVCMIMVVEIRHAVPSPSRKGRIRLSEAARGPLGPREFASTLLARILATEEALWLVHCGLGGVVVSSTRCREGAWSILLVDVTLVAGTRATRQNATCTYLNDTGPNPASRVWRCGEWNQGT